MGGNFKSPFRSLQSWRNWRELVMGGVIPWLLRDEFSDTRAAGAVNGTPATPGPGTRAVVDTAGTKVAISGGTENITGSNTTTGDPGAGHSDAIARIAGRVCLGRVNAWLQTAQYWFGFSSNTTFDLDLEQGIYLSAAAAARYRFGANQIDVAPIVTGNTYQLGIVLRSTGSYIFIKGPLFISWTLLWVSGVGNITPLYVGRSVFANAQTQATDFVRIPDELYLPTPLAYDSFTRGNGPLGSSEATGPDGQTAPVKVWQSGGATWTIAGNEAVNTPTEGAEIILNGNFTAWTGDDPDSWTVENQDVNNDVTENPAGECQFISTNAVLLRIRQSAFSANVWFTIGLDCTAWAAGSLVVGEVGVANFMTISAVGSFLAIRRGSGANDLILSKTAVAADITIDDVTMKALTLNTLFSNVETGTADVVCQVELDTVVTGTQAGLVLNLDDKDTPANFVIAYHDGTNCVLEKCVAGTYTGVISAAAAYAAGATLVVIKEGTAYSLYYNNAQVGTTQTVGDAGIIDNTLHGMFSTYSGNQLDNFYCLPRGTNGEYDGLNRYGG